MGNYIMITKSLFMPRKIANRRKNGIIWIRKYTTFLTQHFGKIEMWRHYVTIDETIGLSWNKLSPYWKSTTLSYRGGKPICLSYHVKRVTKIIYWLNIFRSSCGCAVCGYRKKKKSENHPPVQHSLYYYYLFSTIENRNIFWLQQILHSYYLFSIIFIVDNNIEYDLTICPLMNYYMFMWYNLYAPICWN